ncbi:MAG TPA: hypothetical protein VF721_10095 [Pyrinomonadaceae bacterium]|jgi:hypothetical protein
MTKPKLLFSILFVCLSAVASFAQTDVQDRDFNVFISIKDQTLLQTSADSAIASFAQTNASQQPVEISVSSENPTFFVNTGAWLVKVKITNNKRKTLKTKNLGVFSFIFGKPGEVSIGRDFSGVYYIEERKIKPGESFEFEVDLRKLNWNNPSAEEASYLPDSEKRSPYQPVLPGNYEVYMRIPVCDLLRGSGIEESCIDPAISCFSNKLAVKVEVKTDK